MAGINVTNYRPLLTCSRRQFGEAARLSEVSLVCNSWRKKCFLRNNKPLILSKHLSHLDGFSLDAEQSFAPPPRHNPQPSTLTLVNFESVNEIHVCDILSLLRL
ncbi:hypothetical protein J6590_093188 [Homalodisca vitripennis]|nr:hypothetical protein J6590_093188 [Homalodisca vitripennis]